MSSVRIEILAKHCRLLAYHGRGVPAKWEVLCFRTSKAPPPTSRLITLVIWSTLPLAAPTASPTPTEHC